MFIKLSQAIHDDVDLSVRAVASQSIVLNVFATAEAVRKRHESQNVALEDIAALVATKAGQCGCAIEFGSRPTSDVVLHSKSE
jgi:hypothetical protein